jgi:indolepyruvate ferredoxin oxidoreductase
MWYGKGPGVDRSGDPFKHGNAAGTSRYGGVIAVAGDDHTCKSSSLPHQSEYAFIDASIPVLNPANVEEIVGLGLYGYALSRFSGCWVGLKVTQETADATQSFALLPQALEIVTPDFALPAGGLNIRWPDPPNDQERRLHRYKLPAALAFARANALDRTIIDSRYPRLGLVTTGKAHLDVLQALEILARRSARRRSRHRCSRSHGVGRRNPRRSAGSPRASRRSSSSRKTRRRREPAQGQLYNWQAKRRPLIVGKQDERGEWHRPNRRAYAGADRARSPAYRRFHPARDRAAPAFLEERARAGGRDPDVRPPISARAARTTPRPTCPRAAARWRASAAITWRNGWIATPSFTQMGGEGATWIGKRRSRRRRTCSRTWATAPTPTPTLGDPGRVAAGVNMTYKILFNDAVAMTGGQPVEGHLTVAGVAQQLVGEGVRPIIVVTDEPQKYAGENGLPPSVTVHHRRELERLQRELREVRGVSALIYDQTCAAELHRKRKRGTVPTPDRRVVINELVCEGCGDCNVQSNCLSVMALDTELGRKRRINQSSCNQDFSCLNGFCPSFVTLRGAKRNPPRPLAATALPSLPEPRQAALDGVYNALIAGVGGTGVVTASGLLGLAAHLEGKAVHQLDQTGLAQKYGGVLSHVRIAADPKQLHGMRIPAGQVDLLLGADLIVAAGKEPLSMLSPQRSAVIVNTHEEMPSDFIRDRDFKFPAAAVAALRGAGRSARSRRSMRRASLRRCSATASAQTC